MTFGAIKNYPVQLKIIFVIHEQPLNSSQVYFNLLTISLNSIINFPLHSQNTSPGCSQTSENPLDTI